MNDEGGLKRFPKLRGRLNPMINSINGDCTIDLTLHGFRDRQTGP